MIEIMALEIFLEAAILCTILSMVAKHEADVSFSKVAMVVAIISVTSFMLEAFLRPQLGPYVAVPIILLTFYIIKTMCWLTVKKAILVVSIFAVFHIGLGMLAGLFIRQLDKAINEPMQVGADRMEAKQREILESIGGDFPDMGVPVPTPAAPAARPEPSAQAAAPIREEPTPAVPEVRAIPTPVELSKTLRTNQADDQLPGEWNEARQLVRVDGIVAGSGNAQMALINGTLHRKGDRVSVLHGARRYVWKIKNISKAGLDLEPVR